MVDKLSLKHQKQGEISYILLKIGINHNIDELLVGCVTQIRLKQAGQAGEKRRGQESPGEGGQEAAREGEQNS